MKYLVHLISLLFVLAFVGCDKAKETTTDVKETATEAVEEVAEESAEALEEVVEEVTE